MRANCPRKNDFSKRLSRENLLHCWTFCSKSDVWYKGCFKIRHTVKTPVHKMTICVELTKNLTYSEFLDSNSDALLKTCFKIWFFSKVLRGNCFFFHFFHQLMVFEKTHNCKSWRFHVLIRSKKVTFWKQNIHQSLFCTIPLQNLMRCKTFSFEIWHVLKFSIRSLSSCKKMALSLTRLKLLIQNMTRCTKNDSKADYFQNALLLKTTFSEKPFQERTKKPSLTFLGCKLTV